MPCRRFDPDLWFADAPAELELAKSLCGDCPVRVECLAGALERAEPWGVWGGEIFERGAVIARKRPRGRPRKDDVARGCSRVDAERTLACSARARRPDMNRPTTRPTTRHQRYQRNDTTKEQRHELDPTITILIHEAHEPGPNA